jgi:enoyl-CoA hydratase/carnithine racemase
MAEALAAAATRAHSLPTVGLALAHRRPPARASRPRSTSSSSARRPRARARRPSRCPLAAATLVQILRHGRTLDLHERLVAESLAYSTLQAGPEFAAWLAARGIVAQREHAGRPAVRARREGARLRLTLDRPHQRNAFSLAMRDALAEGLALALADDSIEEVLLDGEGPSFCSGGDLDEFGSFPDPATAHAVRSARSPRGCSRSARSGARGCTAPASAPAASSPPSAGACAPRGAFFQPPKWDGSRARGGWDGEPSQPDRAPAHRLARPLGDPHRRRDGSALGARRRDREVSGFGRWEAAAPGFNPRKGAAWPP